MDLKASYQQGMKIETLPGLIEAHETTPGHVLLLDMNHMDRRMESFPTVFLQECKLIVEIDRGAGVGFVRKSRAVRRDNLMDFDGHEAVMIG